MAQKYSRKSPSRSSQKGNNASGSTFQTFLFGVLVGALATYFLPILLQNNNATTELPTKKEAQTAEPDFEFPDILRGTQIPVNQSKPEPTADVDVTYLLQVGSFINPKDADGLRAFLVLENFTAFIQPFKTETGSNMHRVIVGPFDTEKEMISARIKLRENDLNPLLLRKKD